ncbi:hypothetical protein BDW_13750 [Bdellovibrio bacteriovorus W]|nr:hypothetical protein BDW_13750 [Bdellovibrio bacteriovorus W]
MRLNHSSTFQQNLKNRHGQVALFLALIFQVLFLFFAMVINVGLLVHHKINLQNSVDFAAYYGAMKQAENMNVIAHTNYQIRQSWKLLTWRYRMLGSAGDFFTHPFSKYNRRYQGTETDGIDPAHPKFYDQPSFCITYIPFKPMPRAENTCRDLKTTSSIPVFRAPSVSIDLPGISNATRALSEALRASAFKRCQDFGAYNYLILGSFIVSYNIDQGGRNVFINTLANSMSPSEPSADFYDIDGDSVKEGMRLTLDNNLTEANRNSVQTFKTYNSLGDSQCNASGISEGEPAKWLKPIKVAPGFVYVDTECGSGDKIVSIGKFLGRAGDNLPHHSRGPGQPFYNEIQQLLPWIRVAEPPLNHPFNFSLGVEKNPYCMAYVGASAVTQPKIPFSPLGSIQLKARAFFKPFGGRIGPWYHDRWTTPTGIGSGPGKKVDAMVPPRVVDLGNLGDESDPTRAANYSRFVGDQYGLKSRNMLYEYGRAVYGLDPAWQPVIESQDTANAIQPEYYGDGAPNFDHWRHLPFDFHQKGNTQDILAWDWKKNEPSRMRELELAGILPDAFDMAYYSIEPNFYHKYYKRITEGFLAKRGSSYYALGRDYLGDIGTHKGFKSGSVNYSEFSVIDQYKVVKESQFIKDFLDFENRLSFVSRKWEDVLTGWAPLSLTDFSLATDRFAKCQTYPLGVSESDSYKHTSVPTSGNCISGGSTGYFVKMVSSDFLKGEIPNLGGEGVSGRILNPPPDDF